MRKAVHTEHIHESYNNALLVTYGRISRRVFFRVHTFYHINNLSPKLFIQRGSGNDQDCACLSPIDLNVMAPSHYARILTDNLDRRFLKQVDWARLSHRIATPILSEPTITIYVLDYSNCDLCNAV